MRDVNNLAHQAELLLIDADARFFLNLTLEPGLEPLRPIASLALMPFLSAFVYESARYIQDPTAAQKLDIHEEMLVASRMRLKLIEDRYRSSAEVLENAQEMATIVSRWFLEGHRGILGSLKRRIQPDLGIFFLQNEIICTTHVAFLNMGLTEKTLVEESLSLDTLGPYLHDRMIDVGEYIGLLSGILGIDADAMGSTVESRVPRMGFRDTKSKKFYNSMDSRIARGNIPISILMTSILSQINTARLLVPKIAQRNEIAAWKMRFVSVYQATLSLRKLLEEHRDQSFLHPDAIQWLDGIVNDDSVRKVGAYRGLRNILVHYRIDKRARPGLSPELPLSGVVEASTDGKSLQTVENEVEQGLHRVSEEIRNLIPQAFTPEDVL